MNLSEIDDARHPIAYAALRRLVTNYEWIHTGIGLIGNTAFLIGSIFVLSESLRPAGTWLFIAGASGMLLGSIGRAIVDATETTD